jgi:diguanylate cyclase (GGDEF)-like protein
LSRCLLLLFLLFVSVASEAVDAPATLIERSRLQARVDPERSRQLAQQALEQLASAPDPELQLLAHAQLCDYYAERDRAAAEQRIELARALLGQIQRAGLRARLLTCEGEIQSASGNNVEAVALFHRAVSVAEASGEQEILADALFQRGYVRGLQGEFANGLADLQKAHAIYERLNLTVQTQISVNGIATLYNRMGDYRQARQYYELALKRHRAAGLTREQVVTEYNLGRVYENLGELDAAQRAFEAALALSRELAYARGEAYALRGLGSVRNARGAPADALELLESAEKLQSRLLDERLRAQILLQRGIALRLLNRPAESTAALQQALVIFTKADSMSEVGPTHLELARAQSALGDWKGAYEQQSKAQAIRDGIVQRQLDQRFTTLKIEFDSATKDKENTLLLREKEATERALVLEQHANRLQAVALGLIVLLACMLAAAAWRSRIANSAMRTLAMTDELTGVPNRRDVLRRAEAVLVAAVPGARCAMLIVDIDHFKSINDEHGHLVGDEILRAVAQALRAIVHEPAALGRLGGEEFVIVMPETDEGGARYMAERILSQVRALDVSPLLPRRRMTVSIGFTVSAPADTVTQMLRRADQALYAAKSAGRDRVAARSAIEEALRVTAQAA